MEHLQQWGLSEVPAQSVNPPSIEAGRVAVPGRPADGSRRKLLANAISGQFRNDHGGAADLISVRMADHSP